MNKEEIKRILDKVFAEFNPQEEKSKEEILADVKKIDAALIDAGYSPQDPKVRELIQEKLHEMVIDFEVRGLL